MNTRIRYSKNPNGVLVSKQILKADNGREYKVTVNPDGKTGSIIDAFTGDSSLIGPATSAHKIRIKIKQELERRGVKFIEEVRKSKPHSTEEN